MVLQREVARERTALEDELAKVDQHSEQHSDSNEGERRGRGGARTHEQRRGGAGDEEERREREAHRDVVLDSYALLALQPVTHGEAHHGERDTQHREEGELHGGRRHEHRDGDEHKLLKERQDVPPPPATRLVRPRDARHVLTQPARLARVLATAIGAQQPQEEHRRADAKEHKVEARERGQDPPRAVGGREALERRLDQHGERAVREAAARERREADDERRHVKERQHGDEVAPVELAEREPAVLV